MQRIAAIASVFVVKRKTYLFEAGTKTALSDTLSVKVKVP